MTRQWMIDPKLMCQQHRLGSHKEIHDLVGFIRNGHIEKVRRSHHENDYTVVAHSVSNEVQFHATRGQVFPQHISMRHEQLEAHDGLDSPICVPYVVEDLQMTEVTGRLLRHNRQELARRCDECAKKQEEVL